MFSLVFVPAVYFLPRLASLDSVDDLPFEKMSAHYARRAAKKAAAALAKNPPAVVPPASPMRLGFDNDQQQQTGGSALFTSFKWGIGVALAFTAVGMLFGDSRRVVVCLIDLFVAVVLFMFFSPLFVAFLSRRLVFRCQSHDSNRFTTVLQSANKRTINHSSINRRNMIERKSKEGANKTSRIPCTLME